MVPCGNVLNTFVSQEQLKLGRNCGPLSEIRTAHRRTPLLLSHKPTVEVILLVAKASGHLEHKSGTVIRPTLRASAMVE